MKNFRRRLNHYFHESLALRGCLYVTLLCEEEKHGRKLYLSLCNEKLLMDSHGSLLVFGFT
jgi:hypothetical protein